MEQQQEQPATATNGAQRTVTYWDPERDRPRGINLVRLEVHNRKTAGLQLPRGWLLQPGISVIEVYADEVKLVEAMVEPRLDLLEAAKESYRLAIADDAKGRVVGFDKDASDFLRRMDAGELGYAEAYEYVRARSPLSPEAMFHQTQKRDPLPLSSCKVLESNIAEPKRAAVRLIEAENSKSRTEIGQAIAEGVSEAMKPFLSTMVELLKQNQNRKQ